VVVVSFSSSSYCIDIQMFKEVSVGMWDVGTSLSALPVCSPIKGSKLHAFTHSDIKVVIDVFPGDLRCMAGGFFFFFFFCGGKKGNASCTVTLVRRVWDSSTTRRWEQPPVGRSAA